MTTTPPPAPAAPPTCSLCVSAGYTPGSELFDPAIIPHLRKLDAHPDVRFEVHRHGAVYNVACIMRLPGGFEGVVMFDAPSDENPENAIKEALAAVENVKAMSL